MPDAGSTASAPYKFAKRICTSPFGVAGSRYPLEGASIPRARPHRLHTNSQSEFVTSPFGVAPIPDGPVGDGFQPSRNVTPSAAARPSGQLPKRYGSGGLKSLPYRRIRDIPSRKQEHLPAFSGRCSVIFYRKGTGFSRTRMSFQLLTLQQP